MFKVETMMADELMIFQYYFQILFLMFSWDVEMNILQNEFFLFFVHFSFLATYGTYVLRVYFFLFTPADIHHNANKIIFFIFNSVSPQL